MKKRKEPRRLKAERRRLRAEASARWPGTRCCRQGQSEDASTLRVLVKPPAAHQNHLRNSSFPSPRSPATGKICSARLALQPCGFSTAPRIERRGVVLEDVARVVAKRKLDSLGCGSARTQAAGKAAEPALSGANGAGLRGEPKGEGDLRAGNASGAGGSCFLGGVYGFWCKGIYWGKFMRRRRSWKRGVLRRIS
jgi:hypothetical protein